MKKWLGVQHTAPNNVNVCSSDKRRKDHIALSKPKLRAGLLACPFRRGSPPSPCPPARPRLTGQAQETHATGRCYCWPTPAMDFDDHDDGNEMAPMPVSSSYETPPLVAGFGSAAPHKPPGEPVPLARPLALPSSGRDDGDDLSGMARPMSATGAVSGMSLGGAGPSGSAGPVSSKKRSSRWSSCGRPPAPPPRCGGRHSWWRSWRVQWTGWKTAGRSHRCLAPPPRAVARCHAARGRVQPPRATPGDPGVPRRPEPRHRAVGAPRHSAQSRGPRSCSTTERVPAGSGLVRLPPWAPATAPPDGASEAAAPGPRLPGHQPASPNGAAAEAVPCPGLRARRVKGRQRRGLAVARTGVEERRHGLAAAVDVLERARGSAGGGLSEGEDDRWARG
ncbi:nascent polypeptide-associated complex subunit alpha, muscle-specific form-like [Panicum virgatum]|uniref:nascent polypeptide-associated complex subunit alpha, muscle-specific form-like n=1 Tax=Panicum virgatum TaxID=38727 RepID=UPI0019D548BE|nr:nascent polypeptide-associated complex subunit alpha, muscle-specific form-like [Panicum virgatum]